MKPRENDPSRAPFSAYHGDLPYVFVSYAHKDSAVAYPDITALHEQGYRVWYDEGIEPGSEWPEDVAKALDGCSLFLLFISPNAVASHNVWNETHFAISRKKPIVAVHIQETEMPRGLELQLGSIQAILRFRETEEQYKRRLERAFASFQHLRGEALPAAQARPVVPERQRATRWIVLSAAAVAVLALAASGWWYVKGQEKTPEPVPTPALAGAVPDTGGGATPAARPTAQPSPSPALQPASRREEAPPVGRIPNRAIICASGPGGPRVESAVAQSLSEQGVPVLPSRSEACESLADELLRMGRVPQSIVREPDARVYIAVETWVTIQDTTYWMADAGGQAALAIIGPDGARTRQFTFTGAQVGVQPSRAAATQACVNDLVEQNRAVFRSIADAVRARR